MMKKVSYMCEASFSQYVGKAKQKKMSYMCEASLTEYVGNSRDPDEKFLSTLFLYMKPFLEDLIDTLHRDPGARSSGHVQLAEYEISVKDFPALKHALHFVF